MKEKIYVIDSEKTSASLHKSFVEQVRTTVLVELALMPEDLRETLFQSIRDSLSFHNLADHDSKEKEEVTLVTEIKTPFIF